MREHNETISIPSSVLKISYGRRIRSQNSYLFRARKIVCVSVYADHSALRYVNDSCRSLDKMFRKNFRQRKAYFVKRAVRERGKRRSVLDILSIRVCIYRHETINRDTIVTRISVHTQEHVHAYTSPLESPLNS